MAAVGSLAWQLESAPKPPTWTLGSCLTPSQLELAYDELSSWRESWAPLLESGLPFWIELRRSLDLTLARLYREIGVRSEPRAGAHV